MNKLSDYRIKETPDGFIIEMAIYYYEPRLFRKYKVTKQWQELNFVGEKPHVKRDYNPNFIPEASLHNQVKVYDSKVDAQAKIIEWCEYPKYHYIASLKGEHKVSDIKFFGTRCKILYWMAQHN